MAYRNPWGQNGSLFSRGRSGRLPSAMSMSVLGRHSGTKSQSWSRNKIRALRIQAAKEGSALKANPEDFDTSDSQQSLANQLVRLVWGSGQTPKSFNVDHEGADWEVLV